MGKTMVRFIKCCACQQAQGVDIPLVRESDDYARAVADAAVRLLSTIDNAELAELVRRYERVHMAETTAGAEQEWASRVKPEELAGGPGKASKKHPWRVSRARTPKRV